MKQKGILYGIGVGPGDPELLTLKAYRVIQECQVAAAPGKIPEETTAYGIAAAACPFLKEKELAGVEMPMTKDPKVLEKSHEAAERKLRALLDAGKDVAFLTLGDPCVYSTYFYLHTRLQEQGYEARIISGIPSFCAAAARLGITLGEKAEEIHIIPASYQIEEALKLPGTKVLMKAGRKMPKVKKILEEAEAAGAQVTGVENCGMEQERIYQRAEDLPEDAGYFTLIFVREGEKQ